MSPPAATKDSVAPSLSKGRDYTSVCKALLASSPRPAAVVFRPELSRRLEPRRGEAGVIAFSSPCRLRRLGLLRSQPATEPYSALTFWDAKRPITAKLLNQLDLAALAKRLG